MKFQMPFNSRVHIRLFERVSTPDSECHRVFDVLGLEDDDGDVDAITAGYASRLHTERGRKSVSKAAVKTAKTAAVVAPAVAVTVVATPTVAAPMAAVAIATAVIHTALDNDADDDNQVVAA